MDNIKVAIRVRPLIKREQGSSCQVHWKADTDSIVQVDSDGKTKGKSYNFDRVFSMSETTNDVYEEVAQPIVKAAMDGYDGTIFAYGQTSSGKTFTMLGDEDNPGIIPLAVGEIFQTIQETPEREFLLRAYYVELYNEVLVDLLATEEKELKIREVVDQINTEKRTRVTLTQQTEEVCRGGDEIMALIKRGNERRHIGKTNMNEHSSRSHSILCIIIESRKRTNKRESGDSSVIMSRLFMVDLAGSERANETQASGQRFKEACMINTSLSALSMVIMKLSHGEKHIPFRDSKLTRLLQSSLGGNAKTAIIGAVTPATIDQTNSTLQFAARAKTIQNTATVNEIFSDEALLVKYKKEIQQMKHQIDALQNGESDNALKTEHDVLKRCLDEKTDLIKAHEDKIRYLSSVLLVSSTNQIEVAQAKKRKMRRETWCPGSKAPSMGTPITKALASTKQLDFLARKPPLPPAPALNLSQSSDEGPSPPKGVNSSSSASSSSSSSVSSSASPDLSITDSSFKTSIGANDDSVFPEYLSSSDEEKQRKRKRRRLTVRFIDPIPEECRTPEGQDDNLTKKQLEETMTMCEGLLEDKQTLEKQLEDKEETNRQLQYENDMLRVQQDLKEYDSESNQIMTLQAQLTQKQKVIDNLDLEVNKYKIELSELSDFTRTESNTIQEQEDEFKDEIRGLEQLLEEKEAKLSEMSSQLDQVQQSCQMNFEDKSLADAEFVVMDLRKKLSESTDRNRQLSQDMEKVETRIAQLNREKGDFDSHMLFEKERHYNMVTDLKEQLQRAYNEISALTAASSSSASAFDATNNSAAVAATSANTEPSVELAMLTDELTQSKKSVEELNAKIVQLQKDLEDSIDASIDAQQDLMSTQDDLEKSKNLVTQLKAQLASKTSPADTNDDTVALLDRIEELQQQLESQTIQQTNTSDDTDALHGRIEELTQQLESQTNQQSLHSEEQDRIIGELRHQLETSHLQNSAEENSSISDRLKQLEEVILEKEKAIDTLELRVEMSKSAQLYSEEMEERVKELETTSLDKDNQIDAQKHQLETLQMIKLYSEELEGRVSDLEGEVLEWSDRCVKLEEEMDVKVGYLEKQLANQRHSSVSMDNTLSSTQDLTQQEVAVLAELNNDLETKVAELQAENDVLRQQITDGQGQVEAGTSDADELNQISNEKESRIGELEEQLQDVNRVAGEEVNALMNQIGDLTEQVHMSKEEDQKIVEERDSLQAQIDEGKSLLSQLTVDLEASKQECVDKQKQIGELEGRIVEVDTGANADEVDELRKQIRELTDQVSIAKEENLKIGEDHRSSNQQIDESKACLSQLTSDLAESKQICDEKKQVIMELQAQLLEHNTGSSEQVDELKKQVAELSEEVHIAKDKNQLSNQKLHEANASLSQMTSDLAALNQVCDEKNQKISELEEQFVRVNTGSSDEAVELRMKIGELTEEASMAKEENQKLVEECQSSKQQIHEANASLSQLTSDLAELNQVCDEKNQKISELEEQFVRVNTGSSDEAVELRMKIGELTEEASMAKEENQKIVEDCQSSNQQIHEAHASLSQLTSDLAKLNQVCDVKNQKISELEEQLVSVNTGSSDEAVELRMKIEELTEEVSMAKEENQKIVEDHDSLEQTCNEKELKIDELEKQLLDVNRELCEEAEELRKQIEELTEQLHIADEENQNVVEDCKSLKELIENGKAYVAQLTADLAEANQVREEQEQSISELEARLQEVDAVSGDESDLRKEIEKMVEERDSLKDHLSQLTSDLAKSQRICDEQERGISGLEKQLQDANRISVRLQEQIQELTEQMAVSKDDQARSNQTCEEQECRMSELAKQLVDANKVIEAKQVDLRQYMEHTAALEQQVMSLEQGIQEKSHTAEQVNSENHKLQGKVRGMASRYESIIHSKSEESVSHTKQLEERVRHLTAELEAAIKSSNDANCSDRQRLSSMECQLKEATSYTQQLEKSRHQHIEQMKATMKDLESKHKEEKDRLVNHMEKTERDLQRIITEVDDELEQEKKNHKTTQQEIVKLKSDLENSHKEHKEEKERLGNHIEKTERDLQRIITEVDDELEQEKNNHKTTQQEIVKLKSDLENSQKEHKEEKDRLGNHIEKTERELHRIITEVEDELEQEKNNHKTAQQEIVKLKTSLEELQKTNITPEETKQLRKTVADQNMAASGYEYKLRQLKAERDERVYNFTQDNIRYRALIKKQEAKIETLKEEIASRASRTAASTESSPESSAGMASASSGVVLEFELFRLKHENEKLVKSTEQLKKECYGKGIEIAEWEDQMKKLKRELLHFKEQAKKYYHKFHCAINADHKSTRLSVANDTQESSVTKETKQPSVPKDTVTKGETSPSRTDPMKRALHNVNETAGAERSPIRRLHSQFQQPHHTASGSRPIASPVRKLHLQQSQHDAVITKPHHTEEGETIAKLSTSRKRPAVEESRGLPVKRVAPDLTKIPLSDWPIIASDGEEDEKFEDYLKKREEEVEKPADCKQS